MTTAKYGLLREQLLAKVVTYADVEEMPTHWRDAPAPGAICFPSTFGILLYMWAHGAGTRDLNTFLDPAYDLKFVDVDLAMPAKSVLLHRARGRCPDRLAPF